LPESGRKVLLGVRPEHLSPVEELNADLKLAVGAVETLGADTLAHGRFADAEGAGGELVARLPGTSAVQPGEILPLAIEPGMTHLFDRESGRRI
jgi:sn-glycerol 3-phosphate transport system ATP-binding protein